MKATDTFRKPPFRHNCAQAIAHKWRRLYADKLVVESYAPYVGGRAPEGLCGALYAAMRACPAHAESIRREFEATCGGLRCSDIKRMGRTPCATCVDTADRLVEKYAPAGPAADSSARR